MSDQRTPADMQDYRDHVMQVLRTEFKAQLAHSQEASELIQLLALVADLTVALDDAPTDSMVLRRAHEIAQGEGQ